MAKITVGGSRRKELHKLSFQAVDVPKLAFPKYEHPPPIAPQVGALLCVTHSGPIEL